jgi:hypothetical protein
VAPSAGQIRPLRYLATFVASLPPFTFVLAGNDDPNLPLVTCGTDGQVRAQ